MNMAMFGSNWIDDEDINFLSHWNEDDEDEDINFLSHWNEDVEDFDYHGTLIGKFYLDNDPKSDEDDYDFSLFKIYKK